MNTVELKKLFAGNQYDELLMDIYLDESRIDYQKNRYVKAIEKFESLYGEADVEIYSAPGRSEISGNTQTTSMVKFWQHLLTLMPLLLLRKMILSV